MHAAWTGFRAADLGEVLVTLTDMAATFDRITELVARRAGLVILPV